MTHKLIVLIESVNIERIYVIVAEEKIIYINKAHYYPNIFF